MWWLGVTNMIYIIYVKLYTHRGKCKMLKKTEREDKEKLLFKNTEINLKTVYLGENINH